MSFKEICEKEAEVAKTEALTAKVRNEGGRSVTSFFFLLRLVGIFNTIPAF